MLPLSYGIILYYSLTKVKQFKIGMKPFNWQWIDIKLFLLIQCLKYPVKWFYIYSLSIKRFHSYFELFYFRHGKAVWSSKLSTDLHTFISSLWNYTTCRTTKRILRRRKLNPSVFSYVPKAQFQHVLNWNSWSALLFSKEFFLVQ